MILEIEGKKYECPDKYVRHGEDGSIIFCHPCIPMQGEPEPSCANTVELRGDA